MATKKPAVKKPVAPKDAKPTKVEKGEMVMHTRGGVIFEMTATIPTQQYGNIMPRIQVVCDTIEEGRAMVMPVIQELYMTYAEKPRDGSKLTFSGSSVRETEKVVGAPIAVRPEVAERVQGIAPGASTTPQATDTPAPVAQDIPAPVQTAQAPVAAPKSEFALRAEKMIGLALTAEAAVAIKTQIEKSEKIPAEEKPALTVLVDAKIAEFEGVDW